MTFFNSLSKENVGTNFSLGFVWIEEEEREWRGVEYS